LSEHDIKDSNVINDVRFYYDQFGRRVDESIYLPIRIGDWYQYLEFLTTGYPSLPALLVINYVDNLQQARTWFWNKYRMDNTKEEQILSTIDNNTEFTMRQLFPILSKVLTEDIILYLDVSPLPQFYIKYILYTPTTYNTYLKLQQYNNFNDIPQDIIKIARQYFIIQPQDESQQIIQSRFIPTGKMQYIRDTEVGNAEVGSVERGIQIPRVVAKYYPNIRVYNVRGQLLMGTPDRPYLTLLNPGVNIPERSKIGIFDITWTDNRNLEVYPPVHIYDPNATSYHPRMGHNINIVDDGFAVYSFNQPYLYGRDYYIYKVIFRDPIASLEYVVSV